MNQFWPTIEYSSPPLQFYTIYPIIGLNYTQVPPIEVNNPTFDQEISQNPQSFKNNSKQIQQNESSSVQRQIILPTIEQLETLKKRVPRKYWTIYEDKRLITLYEKFPNDWQKISKELKDRNEAMCYSRYRRLVQGKKKYWSDEIDKRIVNKVNQLGFQWKQISKFIPDRTPKQIRERYLNFLRPNITKTEWTSQQDIKICELVQKLGRTWKKFQQYLIGRTENQIKGRYYGHLKKILQFKTKKGHKVS